MPDFKTTIDDFFQGRIGFKDLRDGLDQAIAESPESAPAILSALEEYYRAGDLHMQLWLYLRARLAPRSQQDGDGVCVARTQVQPQHAASDAQAPSAEHATRQVQECPPAPPRSGTAARGIPDAIAKSIGMVRAEEGKPGKEEIRRRVGVGTILDHRFVLEQVIARNGIGVIYKARDLRPEEAREREPFLAIEVLDADIREYADSFAVFQRKKIQGLVHPNIATVFNLERDGDTAYMIMELLEGETLEQFIERRWPHGLAPQDALPIIEGMAHALAYAHRHGILHSDFTPANIFLTTDRKPKVLTFGLAPTAGRPDGIEPQKRVSDVGPLGASLLAYASCEMLEGLEPDPRDDVYGLACVAYELLAGHHPFNGMPATTARDEGMRPLPIKSLGRRRLKALLHGLAFRREERISSALELLEELMGSPRDRSQKYDRGAWAPSLFAAALAGIAIYWLAPVLGPIPGDIPDLPNEDISQPWIAASPPRLASLGEHAEKQMQAHRLTTLAGYSATVIERPVPGLNADRAQAHRQRMRHKGNMGAVRQETPEQTVQGRVESDDQRLSSLTEPARTKQLQAKAKKSMAAPAVESGKRSPAEISPRSSAQAPAPAGPTENVVETPAALTMPFESKEIEELYRRALHGSSLAEFSLAQKYLDGDGVPQDTAVAVKWLRRAAEHGSRGAQVNIGVIYAEGRGVQADYGEAMKWFQRAAVRGDADASFNIGILYENGRGIPQDLDEAARWYRRAADRGIVEAAAALQDIENR